MTIDLVGRGARALSDHLNKLYRVFRGIDPDSLALRLATGGGSFQVRHSVTNAALLSVTDAGVAATGALVLPAGSVTSAMIADLTIVGADIAPNTITSDKLQSGIAVPAGSITTNEIADGTIASTDIATAAIHGTAVATPANWTTSTSTTAFPNPMAFGAVTLPIQAGWDVEVDVYLRLSQSLAGHSITVQLWVDGVFSKEVCNLTEAVAGGGWSVARHVYLAGLGATPSPHAFVLHWAVSSGTATLGNGEFSVRAVKR